MKTKKKFIVALCSVSAVAVALLASLIIVFASFKTGTTDGGFDISYTAKNIKATIAAEYQINDATPTTIQTTDNLDLITFTGDEEDEELTKSFKAVNNITIGKNDYVLIHYTITNTDSTNAITFSVTGTSTITTEQNVKVEFATDKNAATWEDNILDIADVDSVEYGNPLELYVKISVDTKTQNASFKGAFNFSLDIND